MENKVNYLVEWIRDTVKQSRTKGVVVGVSGGLDSAVVAYLIKQAFPNNSLGIIMPCKSSTEDVEHAEKVVNSCKINSLTIDLSETHDKIFSAVKSTINEKNEWNNNVEKIGDANTRARLRMTTLYAVANNYQYLVVGTDNASEWYTGYFTKYGDGGVDINPLIHLRKSEVFEMAKFLGVPSEIIEKKPSAGLWEGQTDENEMGTTYEMIDNYLLNKKIPEKDAQLIKKMHNRSEHKRQIVKFPPNFK